MKAVFLAFFVAICSGFSIKSRSHLSFCKQSDPKLNQCLKNEISAVGPYLAKGIPELAIPAIEPLVIPSLSLEQGTKSVNYKATLTNLKVFGLSDFKMDHLDLNLGEKKAEGKITIPLLRLVSDYVLDGKFLLVPIHGNGIFEANLTDVKAVARMVGKLVKRKNLEYVEVENNTVKLTVKKARSHFGNLFNGDKTLSKTTNEFLNENSNDLIMEVMPAIEEVVVSLVNDIANKSFRLAPYENLIPM